MSVTSEFPAPPAAVYALFTDRQFVQDRLVAGGGLDPEVVSLTADSEPVTITTRQGIPASVLPSMVASMMPGNPVTERVETWKADGDGYSADFSITVKGAPASLKGTMVLAALGDGGSTLTIEAVASVPIPMFGGKLEEVITEQIGALLRSESDYTRAQLEG